MDLQMKKYNFTQSKKNNREILKEIENFPIGQLIAIHELMNGHIQYLDDAFDLCSNELHIGYDFKRILRSLIKIKIKKFVKKITNLNKWSKLHESIFDLILDNHIINEKFTTLKQVRIKKILEQFHPKYKTLFNRNRDVYTYYIVGNQFIIIMNKEIWTP